MRISIGGENGKLSNASRKQKLAWGSILMLIGVAISGFGYMNYQNQGDSLQNAVNITGTVTGTEIVENHGRRSTDYSPVISFEYTYQGQTYTSDNMYPPGDTQRELDSMSAAESVTAEYPTGSEVSAYVTPDNPGEAFLKKKRSNGPLLFTGIGAAMVLGGLYVILKP